MALTVGELQVALDAQTIKFNSALNRTQTKLRTFERNANSRVASVSSSFIGLKSVILGVAAALAAVGVARGLKSLVSGSLKTAASFEQLEVRLKAFLGTQKLASEAMDEFITLSAKTPFTVEQVVEAGAALGAVALGNKDALVELTKTATNLAAVTGLGLQEAAGNLQRAMVTGIASADLFRERGVKALVEAVQGIPDLLAIPLGEANKAILATFGPDGTYADAAEQLQFTLGGAFSNVEDAVKNFQASLGTAFTPAAIAGARQFLIPIFTKLQKLVEDNADDIAEFSFKTLKTLITWFGGVVKAIGFVVKGFARLGVWLDNARAATAGFGSAVAILGNVLGFVSDRTVDAALGTFADMAEQANKSADGFKQLEAGVDAITGTVDEMATAFNNISLDKFRKETAEAKKDSEAVNEAMQRAREAAEKGLIDAKTARKQETTLKQIELRVQRIADLQKKAEEPLKLQIVQLNRQLDVLSKIRKTKENTLRIDTAQAALEAERTRVTEKLAKATAEARVGRGEVQGLLSTLRDLDPRAAAKLEQRFAEAFESARGAEAQARVAKRFAQRIKEEIEDLQPDPPATFGENLTGAFKDAMDSGFGQAGDSFLQSFAERLQKSATDSLTNAFDESVKDLEKLLNTAFEGAAKFLGSKLDFGTGEGGGILGGLIGGLGKAIVPLGAGLLSAALKDDDVSATAASIQSAVTSAQQVRGVVAGPTTIAIGEVSRGIQDAFLESERLLSLIAENTRITAANSAGSVGGAVVPTAGTDASAALENESASLV